MTEFNLKEIKRKAKRVLELIPREKGLKLLDIGCGEGDMTNEFYRSGYNAVGLDINQRYIKKAKEKYPKISFGVKDAWKTDYSDYDIIISWGVFCYVPELEGLLKKIEREMKKDSVLIFTVPNICSLNKRLKCLIGRNPFGGGIPMRLLTFKGAEQLIKDLKFSKKQIIPFHYDNKINKMPVKNFSSHIIFKFIK